MLDAKLLLEDPNFPRSIGIQIVLLHFGNQFGHTLDCLLHRVIFRLGFVVEGNITVDSYFFVELIVVVFEGPHSDYGLLVEAYELSLCKHEYK